MSLSLALNNALTGLQVNQRTMAVISNNIANANTKGYSRQVVDLTSEQYGGQGSGVKIESISRKVDKYLQTSIYNQSSTVGYSDTVSDYYDSIQTLLGDPALGNSLDAHLENFFGDLQSVAQTPERSSTRAAVIQSAVTLTREVSNLALGLEELRKEADLELSNSLQVLNRKLEELYFTNDAIAEAHTYGNNKSTLLDKRDTLIEEISEFIDVRVTEHANGTVDLYAGKGILLVDFGYSKISYNPISDINTLINNNELSPIVVQPLDGNGKPNGNPINMTSGGTSAQVESRFDNGKLAGLLAMRDKQIPQILNQLDQLSSQLRDAMNAVHNQGSGYPAATSFTGTSLFDVNERSQWGGSVMIAALNTDGTPASSAFGDESGARPLTLDLTKLYSGANFGESSMQSFINEINTHFGAPQNRMSVGNFNNVQLAMVSDKVPGATPIIEFDFDIENISDGTGDFWVNSVTVTDDSSVDITSTSNSIPTLALSSTNTFTTTAGNNIVTVQTAAGHGLANGDMVRLNNPGGAIDGIPGSDFAGYFVISNVTAAGFDIEVATPAIAGTAANIAGQTASPPYASVEAGDKARLQQNGTIKADLSGNPASRYYDVSVNMNVRDDEGNLTTTMVTYRILNPQDNTQNDRISARAVTAGSGILKVPDDNRPLLKASLVDADGNELRNRGGTYGQQSGYLKIESLRDGITFAIDDRSSINNGLPTDNPPRAGTNRGFSHHFGLNNFFETNEQTATGDTLKNSALNLTLEQRLRDNPSLISTGNLQRSTQTSTTGKNATYTYERFSGDNSAIQELASLGFKSRQFAASGSLPASSLSFIGYTGEMLGYISANSIGAERTAINDSILMEGYQERADSVSGVNLDEELANTIIYQNAYAASARVISVTDQLFETLLNSF